MYEMQVLQGPRPCYCRMPHASEEDEGRNKRDNEGHDQDNRLSCQDGQKYHATAPGGDKEDI